MTNPVIKVENLSKYYRLGVIGGGTLREDISRWWAQKRGKTDPYSKIGEDTTQQPRGGQIWALEDINLEINEGEILGIIGRNGAGKSTLLKILSRITAPTSGRAIIRGRVGSLLEVGTGFHPELTGRENIYLNGSILGMRRVEVTRKLDEIVEFAAVNEFVDTPVKRYSSGMLVRLAFAVAAHLEPEILIVDEVLAVGDAAFQKKCLGKMRDVSSHGRTVLFVSHNMQSISTLTNACVLVDSGKLSFKGPTEDAIHKYLKTYSGQGGSYTDESPCAAPKIVRVALVTSEPNYKHINGKKFEVEIDVKTDKPLNNACVSFQIIDELLRPIVHCWVFNSDVPLCRKAGIYKLKCNIPELRLYMGEYALIVHFSEREGGQKFQTLEGVCHFEVVMHGIEREYKWNRGACAYIEDFSWNVQEDI